MSDPIPAHLVAYLAHRYADLQAAVRPVDKKTARATFDGACGAVHASRAYGFGTPDHVFMVIMDAVTAAGPRPGGMGTTSKRIAWESVVTVAVYTKLAA